MPAAGLVDKIGEDGAVDGVAVVGLATAESFTCDVGGTTAGSLFEVGVLGWGKGVDVVCTGTGEEATCFVDSCNAVDEADLEVANVEEVAPSGESAPVDAPPGVEYSDGVVGKIEILPLLPWGDVRVTVTVGLYVSVTVPEPQAAPVASFAAPD